MNKGKLKIYYGPMFAGKSLNLIKDINNNLNKTKLVFKPDLDSRSSNKIKSRDGDEYESISIKNGSDILSYIIDKKIEIIYVDEINFFGMELVSSVKEILSKGINIVLSGLDKDYRTEYFPPVKELIEIADEKISLKARCFICDNPSELTSRYINGKPDSKDSKTFICDTEHSKVEYKTLCDKHHPLINKEN